MTAATVTYEDYAKFRAQAAAALDAVAGVFRQLEAAPRADQLARTRAALQNDTFKVLIVGEFKRGKSTLINALLGQSVLPAKVAPCTAIITRVRYGAKKRAVLIFKEKKPPLEISLETSPDALKTYITIQNDDDSDDDGDTPPVNTSPYAGAEVFYPLPLCKNNVEIVDSPGLNEHKTRTELTKAFLAESDAMILVLSCEQALSESERRFIDGDLQDRDLRDVFFLWNRYDVVRDSPADLDDIKKLSRTKLEPRVAGRARVFYVAAKDALEGRLKGRADLVTRSNMPGFEKALEDFLAAERGRVKLRSPIRTAENAINEALLQLLPHRESLFRQPLEEVRRKLEEQRPRLDDTEKQRERILRSVERRGEAMGREVGAALRTLIAELESGLSRQAATQAISTWETMLSQKKTRDKLAVALEDWLKREVKQWERATLQPLLETHLAELEADLDDQARAFLKNLDAMKAAFEMKVTAKPGGTAEEISGLSRLAGVTLGLVGGVGSMMEGATMGVGHMAKGLGIHLAAGFGLAILGFGVPVILPALAAIGAWRSITGAKRAADQLRASVVKEMSSALRAEQPQIERAIQEQLGQRMAQIHQALSERMAVLVDEVRGQVQAVIQERQQHEVSAQELLAKLAQSRATLTAQAQVLNELKAKIEQA